MKYLLLAAFAAFAAPSYAVDFEASVAQGMAVAHGAAETNEDLALSTLYQRLFSLQDRRREAELRSDEAELAIDDIVLAYHKFDDRMTEIGRAHV